MINYSADSQQLTLKEEDLKPRTPTAMKKEPIDLEVIQQFRNTPMNYTGGSFCEETQTLILNVLEKGASLETAASYALITPNTLKKWLNEGFEEVSKYTDDDFAKGVELSPKARFAMECMQRMAKATIDLGSEFYTRCFETGNTQYMMWWLERLDPDKYHLKKKIESDVNQNVDTHSVVEFKFTNGFSERPKEDQEFLNARLLNLEQKYKKD